MMKVKHVILDLMVMLQIWAVAHLAKLNLDISLIFSAELSINGISEIYAINTLTNCLNPST